MNRKAYPSDVSDAEWEFVAPYLTLMKEDAPQREYSLREVFNGLRWMARAGSVWRLMPHDLPPWYTVYQQTQRLMVTDLREVLRILEGRNAQPSAVKLPEAKKGFVLLPKRWIVERSFGWMSRFRRLARDYEQLAETLVGFHLIAFVLLMVRRYVSIGFKCA
ncbi:transposase [Phormidesmis sp. 146-33]